MEYNNAKGHKSLFIIILLIIVVGYLLVTRASQVSGRNETATTPSFADIAGPQPLSNDIVNCEFKVTSVFTFNNNRDSLSVEGRKIYYKTGVAPEGKQSLITFTGLSTSQPRIKGNLGDSPLTTIKDDTESIVLAEESLLGDTFLYTIFKKEKVATWYKVYKMVTVPFGMLAMGYCF